MPSVIAAAMKITEANNSLSPEMPLKRGLRRIHISKGMLKMRINVMELGRFTLRGSGGRPVTNFDYAPRARGTQCRIRDPGTGLVEALTSQIGAGSQSRFTDESPFPRRKCTILPASKPRLRHGLSGSPDGSVVRCGKPLGGGF